MSPSPSLKSLDTLIGAKSASFWAIEMQHMSKMMPNWKNGETLDLLKEKGNKSHFTPSIDSNNINAA